MVHLVHRYSPRALKRLRKFTGFVVHPNSVFAGVAHCQRHAATFDVSEDSKLALLKESKMNGTLKISKETKRDSARRVWMAKAHLDEKLPAPVKRLDILRGSPASNYEIKQPRVADSSLEYVKIESFPPFHPAFLRDACTCETCVDPSSKQKNFQTTDIPKDIKVRSLNVSREGTVEIVWENDIPHWVPGHKSVFQRQFFEAHSTAANLWKARFQSGKRVLWNKAKISKELEYVNYEDYMGTDEGLFRAVKQLHSLGLLLVRRVPGSEKSVENIALRIGNLRDTFYGRTWDVKSVPQAKNVAYTAQYLGLHMDLLYMTNPPGFQFLHCLQNTCKGGSSLFSDSMYAANKLSYEAFHTLAKSKIAYHYKNAGKHYYFRHPVIDAPLLQPQTHRSSLMRFVNYSPPFQANHIATGRQQIEEFPAFLEAMREFSSLVESEDNLYEYRLQEGECVIFNNRRVLHGRRQFDTASGSRWLKGAYIDTDVLMSKYRVLSERFGNTLSDEGRKLVNPTVDSVPIVEINNPVVNRE